MKTSHKPLNSLPTIIDCVGWYETRGGSYVYINEIKEYKDDKPVTRFNCKGNRYAFNKRGKLCMKEWDGWHISGRRICGEIHPNDIVRKCINKELL